jgi:putative FmdB family regulatory protein
VPTYVYACQQCDDRTEVFQRMSDDPLTQCEKCGGALRRVLFPPAVVYKGSGFYTTDYKNGGRSSADTSFGGESKTESKPDTKTEAKPEAKSETKTETKSEA